MKYCTKCGAQLPDEALFCPHCGTKVEGPVAENNNQPIQEEKPVVASETSQTNPNAKIKGQRVPLYEQKVLSILLVPLVLIGCSIILWIINAFGNTSGITRVFPLLLFMFFSGFLSVMSMIRAVKALTRKIYFKSALSFVLFALLVTCLIIDFVFLIQS